MATQSRFILCILFALLAIAAPWPIGGNWPFYRFVALAFATVAIILACFVTEPAKLLKGRFPIAWLLVLIGAVYIFFQSTSISAALGKPVPIVNLDRFESSGISNVDIAEFKYPKVEAISVYPAATREKLVELLIGIGFFFSATLLITERRGISTVLGGIAISGVFLTFFGLIQSMSWNGKLFWQYPIQGGNVFASYVNKNNCAGFLIITFGAAMFFIARQIIEWTQKNQRSGLVDDSDWESGRDHKRPFKESFIRFVAEIQPKHLYAITAAVIIVTGVVASLSRGGMLAIGGTCLVSFVLLARANRAMVAALAVLIFAGGAAFVVFAEQSDSVIGKLESFSDVSEAAAPRLAHWKDAIPFAAEYWPLGTGAGSYRYVTSTMQTFFFERIFAHAENIYIETLIELGIGGLTLLVAIIILCFSSCVRLLKRNERFDQALGVAGLATIVGTGLASALDFGLYLPANTIVFALMMGMVVGRDFSRREDKNSKSGAFVWVALLIYLFASAWGLYESWGIESSKYAKRQIGIINRLKDPVNRYTSSRSFNEIENNLSRAIDIRPDDSEAHFQMGEYYVARFRTEWTKDLLAALEQQKALAATIPGAEFEEIETETVWQSTALCFIHREYRYAQRGDPKRAEEIKNNEHVKRYLAKAYEHFQIAEQNCERVFKARIRKAQLCALFEPGTETRQLAAALSTNFWNSQVLYECGLLALNSGNQDLAVELWSRCLSNPHSRKYEVPIVEFSLTELPMKRLFEELLPQDPENLIQVARKYFQRPELTLPNKFLLIHTKRVISNTDLSDANRFYYFAEAERLSEEYQPAVENYRKALELEPTETDWRFEYAKCLNETGQYDEAIRQLKKCELEDSSIGNSVRKLLDKIRKDRVQKPASFEPD